MNLDEFEAERKRIVLWYCIMLFVFGVAFVGIVALFITQVIHENTFIWLLIIVSIFSVIILSSRKAKKFENNVKQLLIQNALDNITGNDGKIFWENNVANVDAKKELMTHDELQSIVEEAIDNKEKVDEKVVSYIHNKCGCRNDDDISQTLFNSYYSFDETYYGKYKKRNFRLVEYNEVRSHGKSTTVYLKGTVLKIKCNINYKNKLVIKEDHVFISNYWENDIVKKLKKINPDLHFKNQKLKIFTNDITGSEEVLSNDIINFINSLGNKYTVAFADGDMYIITNSSRDMFKMGSLFKRVDDEKQYMQFQQDIKEFLDIIDLTAYIPFVQTDEE